MSATLIKDAVVLTMRGGSDDVIRGDILRTGIQIPSKPSAVLLTAEDGAEVVDGRRFIVMPAWSTPTCTPGRRR